MLAIILYPMRASDDRCGNWMRLHSRSLVGIRTVANRVMVTVTAHVNGLAFRLPVSGIGCLC